MLHFQRAAQNFKQAATTTGGSCGKEPFDSLWEEAEVSLSLFFLSFFFTMITVFCCIYQEPSEEIFY